MDVKIGPHWYRNSNGTIEIEGLPQIEIGLRSQSGPMRVNFAIFDEVGKLHAKLESSSLVINERRAYELIKNENSLLLTQTEAGKPVLNLKLSDGGNVEIPQGEFYTLKGHLMKITPIEWSVEKIKEKEGETDMKGNAVTLG